MQENEEVKQKLKELMENEIDQLSSEDFE